MDMAFQGSLLDLGDEVRAAPLGSSLRRTHLARGAWIDVRPGWIAGADALFGRLIDAVPWRAERRQMYDRVVDVPRLLCFYGEGQQLPDPALEEARQALDTRYAAVLRHDLGHGDLLVMGGSCQRAWEHAVPKTARPAGPRISVQFRPRGVR